MKVKSKLRLVLLFVWVAISLGYAQSPRQIKMITFSTSSRGFSKQEVFTKNTVTIIEEDHRATKESKPLTVALTKAEWSQLTESLPQLSLPEFAELKSPTMDRAFDGARTSTITITMKNGKMGSHSFDNENPNEKLQPLMKLITELIAKKK